MVFPVLKLWIVRREQLLFLAELGDMCFLQTHRENFGAGVDFLHGDLLQHVPNLAAQQFEVLLWDTPVLPTPELRSVQVYNHGNNFYVHLPIFILHMKDD